MEKKVNQKKLIGEKIVRMTSIKMKKIKKIIRITKIINKKTKNKNRNKDKGKIIDRI